MPPTAGLLNLAGMTTAYKPGFDRTKGAVKQKQPFTGQPVMR
jgi:hypothetical protein